MAQQNFANDSDMKTVLQELRTIKQRQQEIINRLESLSRRVDTLSQRPEVQGAKEASISIKDSPSMGRAQAPLGMVVFSDYQCPYCRRFAENVLPRLKKDYVEPGKLRIVFRDFPGHPASMDAAIAARCAGEQGKYWDMHDELFKGTSAPEKHDWRSQAQVIGLDMQIFDKCMMSDGPKAAVLESMAEGQQLGISGTPMFYLGVVSPDGETLRATERIRGTKPYGTYDTVLQLLSRGGSQVR
jgi:protein-disulfide isomerase